ncbi:MAG: glycoside hydrolase family 127 protein [Opitutaceae bacterium]|nr:glycoside hydrolase family 127 protein [Opitutaceae bacterium]
MASRKLRGVRCVAFILASAGFLHANEWWDKAWTHRQHIGIDASSIGEDLADFPLWVKLGDAHFPRTLSADGGRDLRAIGADGAVLDLEMVSWRPDDIRFYVRIPKIKAGTSGQGFDLYLGNPHAPALPTKLIWDKSHLAVLHLSGDLTDATGRGSDLLKQGFVVQNGWTAGLIMDQSHRWITFDSSNRGYLEVTPPQDQAASPNLTLICRFRPANTEPLTLFSSSGFDVLTSGGRLLFRSGTSELSLDGVGIGQWQSAVFSYNAATGSRLISLGGRGTAKDFHSLLRLESTQVRIGRSVSDAKESQYGGDIEEVRLLAGNPSEAWIKATALNLSEENSLIVPGELRAIGGKPAPPPPPQLLGPSDGSHSYKPKGTKLQWLPSLGAGEYRVLTFKDARGTQLLKTVAAGTSREINLTLDQAGASDIYWTIVARSPQGETRSRQIHRLIFHEANSRDWLLSPGQAVTPQLVKPAHLEIRLQGYLGGRIRRLAEYMKSFTQQNPGLLRIQRERPEKGLPPWAGVFTGQYLSSAQLIWRVTRNPELKAHVDAFVRDLISTQRADGYLGPFESIAGSLELWNHYATLCGLLDYYEDTQYRPALEAARRVADLVIQAYGPAGDVLPKTGGASESISHAIVRLYGVTRDQRYLDLANYMIHEAWNEPGGVAFYHLGQGHPTVSDFPVRRWESVHNIMALSEMYWLSGDVSYKTAFERLWRTLRRTERHITGGFSTNEGLLGTPFNKGTIETCCTVAWSLLSTDMLRLTGDSRVADELEWSAINSALGSIPYGGTCSTYATQPDGLRQFCVLNRQGPHDGRALSCCSTNAARALGNIANWALMENQDGLVLNFYGPSKIVADLESGNRISLEQTTQYPSRGGIRLGVTVKEPETFTLHLRIPEWSAQTRVTLNGKALSAPPAGSYLPIRRQWNTGDTLTLLLDFTPRFQTGAEDYAGKVAVFQGPILFSCDARYNAGQQEQPIALTLDGLKIEPIETPAGEGPWILARLTDGGGRQFNACDFSSAGLFGDKYTSWFDLKQGGTVR